MNDIHGFINLFETQLTNSLPVDSKIKKVRITCCLLGFVWRTFLLIILYTSLFSFLWISFFLTLTAFFVHRFSKRTWQTTSELLSFVAGNTTRVKLKEDYFNYCVVLAFYTNVQPELLMTLRHPLSLLRSCSFLRAAAVCFICEQILCKTFFKHDCFQCSASRGVGWYDSITQLLETTWGWSAPLRLGH